MFSSWIFLQRYFLTILIIFTEQLYWRKILYDCFRFIWLWLRIAIMKSCTERCAMQLYRTFLSLLSPDVLKRWVILTQGSGTKDQILVSRWLHPKLISTLNFLSNWKTMFWVISQEQHSIKTQEFTETNSFFYSFTYDKNIFSSSSRQTVCSFFENLLADRKAVDSTPEYYLFAEHTNQASIFLFT